MLHGGNKQFVFKSHPAIVDGENYNVEIKIRKTPFENKFYIHNMNLQNKNETVSLNAKDKESRGYNSYDLSRTDNIANNVSNVNNNETKFSLDVDSDGNKLTQQQAEYFKNSKVRDENGNLLKVYHGTTENFTVFDKTKGRANMDIQGMFFSPWEIDAKGYGSNVNAYYINITNPASEQMGYKALRKFQGQNNAGVKAREYLESLGYDGVNNGDEEYIAFNSNQIKLADNLTLTENEDVRFSRDVNIDEFDERDYNVINTTGLRGYASLKHEVMTWDNIKYLNQVRCISIDDRFYLYKMLGNETKDIIIYKAKNRTRSEYNAIRRAYGRGFNGNTVSISELIESNRNSSNDNSNIFRYEQGKLDNNDKFDNQKIRAKRESDGRGIAENDNNDNLSEEKYSRDVDYSEYLELKRENKHLKKVQSIDVLYSVNEKITALFLKNKRLFFALLEAGCLSDKPLSIFLLS